MRVEGESEHGSNRVSVQRPADSDEPLRQRVESSRAVQNGALFCFSEKEADA